MDMLISPRDRTFMSVRRIGRNQKAMDSATLLGSANEIYCWYSSNMLPEPTCFSLLSMEALWASAAPLEARSSPWSKVRWYRALESSQ